MSNQDAIFSTPTEEQPEEKVVSFVTDEQLAAIEAAESTESADSVTDETATNTDEQTETETTLDETEEQEDPEQDKINKIVSKRVEREKRKALQEVEYWKQQAIKGGTNTQQAPQQQNFNNPEPTLEQYGGDWSQYTRALTQHGINQYIQQQEQVKAVETQKRMNDSHLARVAIFEKSHPDYRELLEDVADLPVHNDIRQVIWESDNGPALVYHLAQNPEIILKLNDMPSYKRLLELGKLEASLTVVSKVAPKAGVKAPAPVTTTKGSPASTAKPMHKMTNLELLNHLNAQELAKKKASIR